MSEDIVEAINAAQDLNTKLRDSNRRLHAFLNTLQALVSALDTPREDDQIMELLSSSLDALLDAANAALGSVLVLDEDSAQLVYVLVRGSASDPGMTWQRIGATSGVSGWVLRQGEAAIVNETAMDERFDKGSDLPEGVSAETLLCIPIIGQNKNLGVITLIDKGGDGLFTEDDQTLAWMMGRFAGELLHRMSH